MKNLIAKISHRLRDLLSKHKLNNEVAASASSQKSLGLQYKLLYQSKSPPLKFKDVGLRVHSQHEEDGILLFIFALIGSTNKKCVEICAGDGIECNTANLIINHRWIGLLCDGSPKNIKRAKTFYANNKDTQFWPPTIIQEWLTKDNINDIVERNGFKGEIDLLSLDVDGVDYWLWQALSSVSPRVVVLEINHLWGPEASMTVPYRDDFVAEFTQYGSDYAGASLAAFVKLGREKGYRLVGTNAIATNAFFVRNDVAHDWLPEVDAKTCFDHPRAQFGMRQRLPGVKDKPWLEV
jgi:hypothetical protein